MADEVPVPTRQIVINIPTTSAGWSKALTSLMIALLGVYVLWHNNKDNSPEAILRALQGQVTVVESKADNNAETLKVVKEHAEDAKVNSKAAADKAATLEKKVDRVGSTMLTK